MARSLAPRAVVLLAVTILLVTNALVFRGRLSAWASGLSVRAIEPVARHLGFLRAVTSSAFRRVDLARENIALQDDIAQLKSRLVQQEDLQRDIQFYRDAAGFKERPTAQPVQVGIFTFSRAGGVRQAVINRGSTDWIIIGDVVTTSRGELIGVVDRIYPDHATVRLVGDAALEVTARIVSTDISGLVRPERDGSLVLDLVQKDESVTEGALVVTSGDDRYPPGLIIGTVRSVDNDAATLFKIVRLTASVPGGFAGHAVVVRP